MIIVKKAAILADLLTKKRQNKKTIGFVPTMGALHAGHLSLVAAANKVYDLVVVSIFVNPTQFNSSSDFDKYPQPLENDIDLLEFSGTDILYQPSVDEVYGDKSVSLDFDIGQLEGLLEGAHRSGHYKGVVQVVNILLSTVLPDGLFLGAKDYQQCLVISKLVRECFTNITIYICPTIREKDGLAMSSRNTRLGSEERKIASALYSSLNLVREHAVAGNTQLLLAGETKKLTASGFRVDYLVVADAATLAEVTEWNGSQKIIVLVAASLGEIRLIDNISID